MSQPKPKLYLDRINGRAEVAGEKFDVRLSVPPHFGPDRVSEQISIFTPRALPRDQEVHLYVDFPGSQLFIKSAVLSCVPSVSRVLRDFNYKYCVAIKIVEYGTVDPVAPVAKTG